MPTTNLVRCVVISLLLSAVARAEGVPPQDRGPAKPFLISGQIVSGWVESCDEEGFTFRIDDGNDGILVEHLSWDTIPRTNAKQIRDEMLPREAKPAVTVRVDMVPAVTHVLKNGKRLTGIPLPDLDTEGTVFIKTRTAPRLGVPRDQIVRTEDVQIDSRDAFTPVENRSRLRAEIRPATGAEYMEFANRLFERGDYEGAVEAYDRASILDAAHAGAAQARITRARAILLADKVASLATAVGTDVRGERYQEALDSIRMLARLAPDDPIVLRLQSQVPELERKLAMKLRLDIVAAYHLKMEELIRALVYGRPLHVGAPSGVVVTTTTGAFLRGRVLSESPEVLIIDMDGTPVTIERVAIVRINRVPLSALRNPATFDEAREYVTDTAGGLAADTVAALVKQFSVHRLTEADIKQLWGGRLKGTIEYTSLGAVIITQAACPYREASYGKGTWLRPGATTKLDPDDASAHADLSSDANRWYASQPFELRYQVLRAIAAEAQCSVDTVYFTPCNHCGGTGFKQIIGAIATPQGAAAARRVCPTCRGLKRFAVVRYR